MANQPVWKRLTSTDDCQVFTDETGVYAPEMELAQEIFDSAESSECPDCKGENTSDCENPDCYGGKIDPARKFELYRFPLDKLKIVVADGTAYMVPEPYNETWPHAVSQYVEWFDDSLPAIAACCGTTETAMSIALTSDDIMARAWAYRDIGSYHGFMNLDAYPLTLTEKELNKRWEK
jgi:hypothetical protein